MVHPALRNLMGLKEGEEAHHDVCVCVGGGGRGGVSGSGGESSCRGDKLPQQARLQGWERVSSACPLLNDESFPSPPSLSSDTGWGHATLCISWMLLCFWSKSFPSPQMSATQDPVTLQHVYTISQVAGGEGRKVRGQSQGGEGKGGRHGGGRKSGGETTERQNGSFISFQRNSTCQRPCAPA